MKSQYLQIFISGSVGCGTERLIFTTQIILQLIEHCIFR